MLMFWMMMTTGVVVYLKSATHTLSYLLLLEVMVLTSIMVVMTKSTSWLTCLMLLLISVCLGVYGISLFISISRSKGFTFFFSL